MAFPNRTPGARACMRSATLAHPPLATTPPPHHQHKGHSYASKQASILAAGDDQSLFTPSLLVFLPLGYSWSFSLLRSFARLIVLALLRLSQTPTTSSFPPPYILIPSLTAYDHSVSPRAVSSTLGQLALVFGFLAYVPFHTVGLQCWTYCSSYDRTRCDSTTPLHLIQAHSGISDSLQNIALRVEW